MLGTNMLCHVDPGVSLGLLTAHTSEVAAPLQYDMGTSSPPAYCMEGEQRFPAVLFVVHCAEVSVAEQHH